MSNIQWVGVRVIINAFVESETQLNLLSEIGCIFFQILQFYLHPMTDRVCIELQISLQCLPRKTFCLHMYLSLLPFFTNCLDVSNPFQKGFIKRFYEESVYDLVYERVESYNANQVS